MKISVIGAGYVGLVTAAGLSKLGHKVFCVDKDEEKIKKINNKESPIYEKGLREILLEKVSFNLIATNNLRKAINETDVTFLCVGTPSRKEGEMYMGQVESASIDLGKILKHKKRKHLIVVKSTVIPETTERIIIPLLEKFSKKKFGKHFGVCMNPEFLREGSAVTDFFYPDRIIIGSTDKKSIDLLKKAYNNFRCPILETNFREAEMIKYASNAFLATKISFINELGNICKRLGINTNIVAKGIGLDKRIGPHFLRAGIGFGGSCFPKDVSALIYKSTKSGYSPRLLRAVLDVNREQPLKLLEILQKYDLKNKKITVLGLTFKEGTDDIRESPSLNVIKELSLENKNLMVYDPLAMQSVKEIFPDLLYAKTAQEAVNWGEIILILTEWDQFKHLNYGNKIVVDGKNLFNGKKKTKNYEGICW